MANLGWALVFWDEFVSALEDGEPTLLAHVYPGDFFEHVRMQAGQPNLGLIF